MLARPVFAPARRSRASIDRWQLEQRIAHAENQLRVAGG
jgi:hypothetical protein